MLYRPTTYQSNTVYEIVSEEDEMHAGAPVFVELSLKSPYMRGEEVAALQRALAKVGHYNSTVDGVFGPNTERSVRAFQNAEGTPVTGIVNSDTAARLGL